MKKVLVLLIMLLMPTMVFAKMGDLDSIFRFFHNENQYNSDWNDERLQAAVILDDGSFIIVGGYENTYRVLVEGDYESYIGIMMRYDKDGNLLWEKPIYATDWAGVNDCVLLSNGDIVLTGDEISARIDEDGKVIWKKDYGYYKLKKDSKDNLYTMDENKYYKLSPDFEVLAEREKERGFDEDIIVDKDDNITFVSRQILENNTFHTNIYVEKVNDELENIWTYILAPPPKQGDDVNRYLVNGAMELNGVTYIIGYFYGDTSFHGNTPQGRQDSFLIALDENGDELWYKIYSTPDDDMFSLIIKNHKNDNILIIDETTTYDPQTNKATGSPVHFLEYSPDGDLIKKTTIYEGKKDLWFWGGFSSDKNGIVLLGESYLQSEDYVYEDDPNPTDGWYAFILHETWPTQFEIETSVEGKGNIEVISSATMGENVTYVVTPDKGYEIDKIIITDVKGAVIEVTDSTFTMPRSNVTIEVIFKEKEIINPDTGTKLSYLFIIILVFGLAISIMMEVMNKKKVI